MLKSVITTTTKAAYPRPISLSLSLFHDLNFLKIIIIVIRLFLARILET